MQTLSNTERFKALKKLSDLRVEYHRDNLREVFQFTKNIKSRSSKVENLVSIAQIAFKVIRSIRSK